MKVSIIFSALLFLTANVGMADFTRVSAFGGAGFTSVGVADSGVTTQRETGFAGGATIEAAIAPDFGLETGFIASRDRLQIPLLARFLGDNTFTIALGPVAHSETGDGDAFRFGAAVAPGLNFAIPGTDDLKLFVEGRVMRLFSDGIADFSDDQNHFDALVGVRLALR